MKSFPLWPSKAVVLHTLYHCVIDCENADSAGETAVFSHNMWIYTDMRPVSVSIAVQCTKQTGQFFSSHVNLAVEPSATVCDSGCLLRKPAAVDNTVMTETCKIVVWSYPVSL